MERDFTAESRTSSRVGDITFIATDEGWLFVASVLDVCTRIVVGWSIADHLSRRAVHRRPSGGRGHPGQGFLGGDVFRSDHGCRYTSGEFKACCEQMGITRSMGSIGDSYDNAMAESLWSSLKRELVDDAYFSQKTKPDWLYSNGSPGIITNGSRALLTTCHPGSSRSSGTATSSVDPCPV